MNKTVKLCLALFLALTVVVQYSFSPNALFAYGLDNTDDAVQTEEAVGNDDQTPNNQNEAETSEPGESIAADTDDVSYPAVTLGAAAGGVKVTINAPEGALPEGTELSVSAVSAGKVKDAVESVIDGEAAEIKAVDISFHYKGKEIEPKKDVSVTFVSKEFAALDDAQVVHITDEGVAEIVSGAKVAGNKATFKSDDFSVYVIVDGDGMTQTYRRTYKFEDIGSDGTYTKYSFTNKAGETVSEQILKTGEALEDVGTPYHTSYDFLGWYIWTGSSWGEEVQFNNTSIVGTLSEDEEVIVRAKYGNVFYLNFHENPSDNSDDIILTTMAVIEGNAVAINDVKAPLPGAGVAFSGWAKGKTGTTALTSPYTPVEDMELYPLFSAAHWLRFVNGYGASYTDAVCVYEDKGLNESMKPSAPSRAGYNFVDWYDSAEGGNKFSWSGTLYADKTVYAHWTPGTDVKYSVFYWAENADDNNYTFITSKRLSGTAEGTTAAALLTEAEKSAITSVDWNGFEPQTITQETIKGDGSTVVNVFYNRKIVTLTFHKTMGGPPTYVEDPNGSYYKVSVSPDGDYYYKTGNGRYDYDYLDTDTYYEYRSQGPLRYVQGDSFDVYEWHWILWPVSGRFEKSSATVTIKRYRAEQGGETVTIKAKYGADIHDLWPTNPGGGTDWYLEPNGNTFLVTLNTTPANDTDYYYKATSSQTTNKMRFMIQDVSGQNAFSEYTTATFKRNSPITTADDYSPIKGFHLNAASQADANVIKATNGADPNAVYDRRFNTSPAIGSSYPSPGHTLNFYYLRDKYDIKFISNGTVVKSEDGIYYGADISGKVPSNFVVDETEATIDGKNMVFAGWYDNKDCDGAPYVFDKMPAGNLTLYAKWETAWYVVKVTPDGGSLNGDEPGGSDATCFWRPFGSTISEYTTTRDYYEVGEEYTGTKYYYHFIQEVPDDSHSADNNRAYYTTDRAKSTDGKVYAKEEGAWSFLGWYVGDDPYDFNSEITGDLEIKAKWRRNGAFTVAYKGVVNNIGGNVSDPTASYADGATITISEAPKTITPKGYLFDGWEIVDANGNTLDNNSGAYYQPGDELSLNAAAWADSNKVIHIQAHYTSVDASNKPIQVTKLIFDANGGILTSAPSVKDGDNNTYSATVENNVATYAEIPVNQEYNLSQINSEVTRSDYVLKGWNTDESKADNGDVEFELGVTVGVDKLEGEENTLYAVWKKADRLEVEALTDSWEYNGVTHYTTAKKVLLNGEDVTGNLAEHGIVLEYKKLSSPDDSGTRISREPFSIKDAGVLYYKVRACIDGGAASEWADGTLTVNKSIITVTTGSATKAYDGTPLTCDEYSIEGKMAPGESIEIKVTGSQTEVGSSPNEFTYTISKAEQTTKLEQFLSPSTYTVFAKEEAGPESNYDIKPVYGTLTVTAASGSDNGDDDNDNASSETKTGDNTNLLGLLAVMTAALLGLIAVVAVRRREE